MSASEGMWSDATDYLSRDLYFGALDRFLLLTRVPDFDSALAWNGAGLAAMRLSQHDRALHYLQRSREAAEVSDDHRGLLRALLNLLNLHTRMGNVNEALRLTQVVPPLCHTVGDKSLDVSAQIYSAFAYGLDHQWTEAVTKLRAVVAELGTSRPPGLMLWIHNNMGVYLHELGQLEEARSELLEALRLGRQLGNATSVAHSLTDLARIALRSGDWDRAVCYGREANDYLWNHMGYVYKGEVARLCEIFGHMALSMGDHRKGLALLERASTYYAQLNWWREWSRVSDLQRSRNGGVAIKTGELPQEAVSTLQYFSDLFGLLDNIESADPTLSRRGQLVTHYALLLSNHMGLSEQEKILLSHAGRLCDIGLTTFEAEAIADEQGPRYKLHPDLSARWLGDFPLPEGTDQVVRAHHERYDGQGYPVGLSGEGIPLGARLLACCEAYVRAMQAGTAHDDAMALLSREAGGALDPAVVEAFIRLHRPCGH